MSDRARAVAEAMAGIEKAFGAGSVMRMGEDPDLEIEVVPSGSISLDLALNGGFPRGRGSEIAGPESTGKTSLALAAAACTQKIGGIAAYIDVEHSLDPVYARALGVDTDALIISQPDYGEQAFEIMEALIKSGGVDLIVLDSVAALVTRQELENDYGSSNVGAQARLLSQAMRKLTPIIHSTNTCAIFINQLRSLIQPFGPSETTAGGRALKYHCSVRLDVRRIETEKSGAEAVANRVRVRVVKSKVSVPHRTAEFSITYGEGISHEGEIVDLGVQKGLIKKGGAWLSYGDEKWQGKPKAIEWLKANPNAADHLEAQIRGAL